MGMPTSGVARLLFTSWFVNCKGLCASPATGLLTSCWPKVHLNELCQKRSWGGPQYVAEQQVEKPQTARASLGPRSAIARRARARDPRLSLRPSADPAADPPTTSTPYGMRPATWKPTTQARSVAPGLPRRLLLYAVATGGAALHSRPSTAASDAGIRFQADDLSFGFELPQQWVPATAPDKERESRGHLISVCAQAVDGTASLQAIVDGGIKGRRYGSSIRDLGSLQAVAEQLVVEELLNDSAANFADVVSSERTGGLGSTLYYVVRYQVGARPAIAKLAVVQQRLYCIKVRATKVEKLDFFERDGGHLRSSMEAICQSFSIVAINAPCLVRSNAGSLPDGGICKVLRP